MSNFDTRVIYTKNTRKGEPIIDFKTNDILDVSLNVNEENNEINYGITYFLNGKIYTLADVTIPKDTGELYIEEWIRQDMDSFHEISD